jgi:hypothetical protein
MIINCTPHDVAIYTVSDCILNNGRLYLHEKADMEYPEPLRVYPAAKEPARVYFVQMDPGMADGILVYRWVPHGFTGFPDAKPGTYYIVSQMLAQVCPEREDLIFPGTLIYDAEDNVVGCIDFSRV